MSILANCIAMAVSQGWDIRAEMAGLSVVFLAIQTLHLYQQGRVGDLGRAWLTTANQAYLVNVLVLPEPPAKRRRRRRVRGPLRPRPAEALILARASPSDATCID